MRANIILVFGIIIFLSGCSLQSEKIETVSSCSLVEKSSYCIDFRGYDWTEDTMHEVCDDIGNFSLLPCPQTDLGGCYNNDENVESAVVWFYNEGGNPYIATSLVAPKKDCLENDTSEWIYQ